MVTALKNRLRVLGTLDFWFALVVCFYTATFYFRNWHTTIGLSLFMLASVAFIISKRKKITKPQPLVYLFGAMYLVRVLWLLVSNDLQYGMQWLDVCLPFLLLPIVCQWLPLNERIVKIVLSFFVHFTLLFCVATLASVWHYSHANTISLIEWLHYPKNYYPLAFAWTAYDHPSFLCILYLFALPVGVYLWWRYKCVPLVELLLLFAGVTAVLAFTGARIGLVILPLLLCLIVFSYIPKKWKKIAAGLIVAGILTGTAIVVFVNTDFTNRFADPIREQLLKTTIYSIKEKPLLGVGTGGMREVIHSPEVAEKIGYEYPQGTLSYPHNQYLGEIMHFGIIGAIPLFALLLYLLVIAVRRNDFLMQALVVILFVFSVTEMPFESSKGINYFTFFISLLVFSRHARKLSIVE